MSKKMIVLITLVVCLLLIVFFVKTNKKPSLTKLSPEVQQAMDIGVEVVRQNLKEITSLSFDCVYFEHLRPQDSMEPQLLRDKEYVEMNMNEIHNEQCGGDPVTTPRISTILIDLKTHEISYTKWAHDKNGNYDEQTFPLITKKNDLKNQK